MIYIFHGDNQKESRQAVNSKLEKLKDHQVTRLDQRDINLDNLNNLLHGASLFSEKKALFISNFFSITKTTQDKLVKIFTQKSQPELDIYLWQDKKLTPVQLKIFPQSESYFFKADEQLFTCLYSIKPQNTQNFLKLYQQVIDSQLYDLFLYFVKNSLRKQLTSYSKFDQSSLKKAYLNLIELDFQNKTGKLNIAKEIALQRIITNLIKSAK
jgi:hypothetical protein